MFSGGDVSSDLARFDETYCGEDDFTEATIGPHTAFDFDGHPGRPAAESHPSTEGHANEAGD